MKFKPINIRFYLIGDVNTWERVMIKGTADTELGPESGVGLGLGYGQGYLNPVH